MKYILDMVHHNPGEPPFQTRFLDPAHLVDYGYNGQVFKHINCIATYAASGVEVFPPGSPERAWLDQFSPAIEREIAAAKARGLKVYYHIDLYVLPRRLVEHFQDEICDPETGRILLDKPRTYELHRLLFTELTARFPQVDGYIIRVGETYLMDTPHHVGNGPIPRLGKNWTGTYLYEETLGKARPTPIWTAAQVEAYVKLINFLRDEICVKHDRQLLFRTWDIFPDKLHAVPEHYLEVTNRIAPHPKLIFSIKHTALDYWRRVKVNECLTLGQHPQIIEVQCQREYEGKGAYPNYVMEGIINGFEENAKKVGLKDLLPHPLIRGVYGWSRGGGWYGPYIKDELWSDLNAYVLAQYNQNPTRGEAEIFNEYATQRLGLSAADAKKFRQLCLLSARAVLEGRYCAAFDRVLNESVLPTACWMRDDRLGGHQQLALVLEYLYQNDLFDEALAEKAEAVRIWDEIKAIAKSIHWADPRRCEHVAVSVEYGRLLFSIVQAGWRVLIAGYRGDVSGLYDKVEIATAAARYEELWKEYRALTASPLCASLYEGRYFNLPGTPAVAGLDDSVHRYKNLMASPGLRRHSRILMPSCPS